MKFSTYPHVNKVYPLSFPLFSFWFYPGYPHAPLSFRLVIDTQIKKPYTFPRPILITTAYMTI